MEEEVSSSSSLIFLLPKRSKSSSNDDRGVDLKSFASCLKWVCVDMSSRWRVGLTWLVFLILGIAVPLASHLALNCSSTCDADHRRPYHAVVQVSLSVFAGISFLCLTRWSAKYGLRRFLFLDKLANASDKVRLSYEHQLQSSMKLWCSFIIPCFGIEAMYKVWWYISGGTTIPHYGNIYISGSIACTLELCSWLYRTSMFFLVCVLYRLICYLQILRIQDFAKVFQKETHVAAILQEHLSFRRCLRIISHRFRLFILLTLLLVTASQFISLLMVTRAGADTNIFKAGDLSLCSISLLTGLFLCLRSATKITHRAQSLTGLAAKWHVFATINSFDEEDDGDRETPNQTTSPQVFPAYELSEQDEEEGDDDDDDEFDNTNMTPIVAHTISFQKRQALVTYLENNRAGITVFGFMLDRTWLHTIFGIEMALTLWLLNKTIT